ncbi:hypothetical protein Pst134EA_025885 [Puccinia striiformis f. sp. tritici]|uniref:hypothetical protein n=1 Tax=Puccinia striiformis f. sp. tritici TaxID=168172 RepID=UPI00200729F9|nr:hypothetical protein Pst134EA_025885 [Puccinia striiformis f. sp. tritici]KAH9444070.1 hypothetical protein Pst134EB_026455 [Puccinia striiformis f. sp. tritici]KAH9451946.1 hypothetical protein Pst134EA_025885 [Puccinia striiformis f. sp. tritici]KAI9615144.1 hypothetical protein H4Q26_011685 [Puccinia striiformis f. sp. tritici PST-130]KAI9629151.1 hypothetical protein KEM48_010997 [Puccinia striiformis f. sp. tritici PST-130]
MLVFHSTIGVLVMICRLVVAIVNPCGGKLPPKLGCSAIDRYGKRLLVVAGACTPNSDRWCCTAEVFQRFKGAIPLAIVPQLPSCKKPYFAFRPLKYTFLSTPYSSLIFHRFRSFARSPTSIPQKV